MFEALLRVHVICPWISELVKESSDVEIVSCRPVFKGSGASAFVRFRSRVDAKILSTRVSSHPYVVKARFRAMGKNSGVGLVESIQCPCSSLGLSYMHVLGIRVEKGSLVFRLLVQDEKEVQEIVDGLRSRGVRFRVEDIRRIHAKRFLTPRQEQVLLHSYLNGYFDNPRPVTLSKLAKDLAITPPSYMELLRKALKKVVSASFT